MPFRLQSFLPYQLSVLSNQVSDELSQVYSGTANVSVWQWRILVVLNEIQSATAKELRDFTAMDKVAISRAVSGLEDKGYIVSAVDSADRRRINLTLSVSGRDLVAGLLPLVIEREKEITSALSGEEKTQLFELLQKLKSGLND